MKNSERRQNFCPQNYVTTKESRNKTRSSPLTIFRGKIVQLSALEKSSLFVQVVSHFEIVHFKEYILQLCKKKFGFICTLSEAK